VVVACATGGTANDADLSPVPDAGAQTHSEAGTTSEVLESGSPDPADAGDGAPTCVESDAGCTTGNPGACGAGFQYCDGGVAVCVPINTTQACYSGDAGTRSIGVCHDGTQSCVGSLGTCTGEKLPEVREKCFDTVDDDCNGVINNGCPDSLYLGADRPLGGAGGAGGGPASVHCPIGAFVTRVDSWFDDTDQHASGVSIYCATPSLVQGAASYSVTLTPNAPAPYGVAHGSTNPQVERTDDCGIVGLTAITYSTGLSDTYVEALGHHCGTSAVTFAADNTLSFNFVPSGDTSYNAYGGGAGAFFQQSCAANEVIVGFNLRDGSWLDNLQPICAALLVKYK
jgi:hypothetical protein